MKPFYYFLFALGLSLPVAFAVAAPPRLTAVGDTLPSPTDDKLETNQLVPASKDGATEKTAEADKTSLSDNKDKQAETQDKAKTVKSSSPNSKESWWSRLFRKRETKKVAITRKKTNALVNTESRHEDVYDVQPTADFERFNTGYDGRWHVKASEVMCRMSQTLPGYGYVEFREGIDQPLAFALFVDHPPAGSGLVRVSSEPPIWRHYVKEKHLGKLVLDNGKRAVIASPAWSRRLLIELSEGMQPVLRFWDAADASSDIEVFVSAIQFQASLDLFQKCLGKLLHYDYQNANARVVYFNPDSSKLRKSAIEQLNDLIEIAKVDSGISSIVLKIYTYRSGLARYNYRLASRRAQGVRDYMIKHGIDADRINIHIFTRSKDRMQQLGYNDTDVYIGLERNKK